MRLIGLRRSLLALLQMAVLVGWLRPAMAQDGPSVEALRAAMVFNFLKFTDFPVEGAGNPPRIRLCVSVRDPRQAEALAALSGRKVGGRELLVTRLAGQDDDCQVLYVDSRQQWAVLAEPFVLRRALTVSAYPGFVGDGGMIELALQNDGVRFDINLAVARRAGLHFSPQLLRLARKVHE